MKTHIDSTWSGNALLDEIVRLSGISQTQSKHLAQALKEKNDLAVALEDEARGGQKSYGSIAAENNRLGLEIIRLNDISETWRSRIDGLKLQRDDIQVRYDELVRRMGENLYYDLGKHFINPNNFWGSGLDRPVPVPAKPKFRVGQFVMALTNNPKWDSVNGEPYRIDKAVVRITQFTTSNFPKGSPFCYSHNGKEGNYSIPEVWFRALRPEEI